MGKKKSQNREQHTFGNERAMNEHAPSRRPPQVTPTPPVEPVPEPEPTPEPEQPPTSTYPTSGQETP